jgi:hypothetical protein
VTREEKIGDCSCEMKKVKKMEGRERERMRENSESVMKG